MRTNTLRRGGFAPRLTPERLAEREKALGLWVDTADAVETPVPASSLSVAPVAPVVKRQPLTSLRTSLRTFTVEGQAHRPVLVLPSAPLPGEHGGPYDCTCGGTRHGTASYSPLLDTWICRVCHPDSLWWRK